MDVNLKTTFEALWTRYFPESELPLACFFAPELPRSAFVPKPTKGHRCVIADLNRARKGRPVALNVGVIGCAGGRRYFGFTPHEVRENFEYFLSCGIPGRLEGERYKKTPELVNKIMALLTPIKAPAENIVFKRWDRLEPADEPEIVIFYARPDVLSGLFTLAGFDRADPQPVIAPFGAGCATIVQYPYQEKDSKLPRCVLGMFDVSARPYVPEWALTFSCPMGRFEEMVGNMEQSFLITDSWRRVRRRLKRGKAAAG